MKHISFGLLFIVLLAGCSLDKFHAFNQHQRDKADNQYREKQIHADPFAAYVGEWTAESNVGTRSIKIKDDGRIKVCLSPSYGTTNGKVYMENGAPAFILESGAKASIISMEKDALLLDIYDKQEKYFAGLVPVEWATVFTNFK